jgi:predicted protein tyrosine phosphatase
VARGSAIEPQAWGTRPVPSDVRVLFVCARNRLRSPTAEQIFSDTPGLEVDSGGLSSDADCQLTPEQVLWADVVFVMEKKHRARLSREFGAILKGKKVVCLDIPDDFEFMDPALVRLLQKGVSKHLPQVVSLQASRNPASRE